MIGFCLEGASPKINATTSMMVLYLGEISPFLLVTFQSNDKIYGKEARKSIS